MEPRYNWWTFRLWQRQTSLTWVVLFHGAVPFLPNVLCKFLTLSSNSMNFPVLATVNRSLEIGDGGSSAYQYSFTTPGEKPTDIGLPQQGPFNATFPSLKSASSISLQGQFSRSVQTLLCKSCFTNRCKSVSMPLLSTLDPGTNVGYGPSSFFLNAYGPSFEVELPSLRNVVDLGQIQFIGPIRRYVPSTWLSRWLLLRTYPVSTVDPSLTSVQTVIWRSSALYPSVWASPLLLSPAIYLWMGASQGSLPFLTCIFDLSWRSFVVFCYHTVPKHITVTWLVKVQPIAHLQKMFMKMSQGLHTRKDMSTFFARMSNLRRVFQWNRSFA